MKQRVLTPKEFILEVDDKIEQVTSYGYPIQMSEEGILWFMDQYADYKMDLARNNNGNFTNGSFSLSWKDVDTVRVQNNRFGKYALIHGGDIEGMFNALIQSTPYKIEPEFNTDRNY